MAVNTTTEFATTGHAGALTVEAMMSDSRAPSIAHRFARRVVLADGAPSMRLPRRGAGPAAASRSEGAAAVTPTTITTISTPTLTPAKYGLAMGLTDEAQQRGAGAGNDPEAMLNEDMIWANARYVDCDSTVGLANALYDGFSNTVGGATSLTIGRILSASSTVWATVGDDVNLVCHIEGYGRDDLESEQTSTTANARINYNLDLLRNLLADDLFGLETPYIGSLFSNRVHVFCSPRRDELKTDTGSKVGAVYVPDFAGISGQAGASTEGSRRVQPALGYVVDERPARVSEKTMVNPRTIQGMAAVHVIGYRAFAGVYQAVQDIVARVGTGELYDAAGVEMRYAAS